MTVFPQLIFGYHGCEREVAEKVVLRKDLLHPSENRWDWLGTGAYFWEGAPERARINFGVLSAVCRIGGCAVTALSASWQPPVLPKAQTKVIWKWKSPGFMLMVF